MHIFLRKWKTTWNSWTTPSPSHSPIEPPNSDKIVAKLGYTKSVLVLNTVDEGTKSIQLNFEEVFLVLRSLVETLAVVQGRKQSEGVAPDAKLWKFDPPVKSGMNVGPDIFLDRSGAQIGFNCPYFLKKLCMKEYSHSLLQTHCLDSSCSF